MKDREKRSNSSSLHLQLLVVNRRWTYLVVHGSDDSHRSGKFLITKFNDCAYNSIEIYVMYNGKINLMYNGIKIS